MAIEKGDYILTQTKRGSFQLTSIDPSQSYRPYYFTPEAMKELFRQYSHLTKDAKSDLERQDDQINDISLEAEIERQSLEKFGTTEEARVNNTLLMKIQFESGIWEGAVWAQQRILKGKPFQ